MYRSERFKGAIDVSTFFLNEIELVRLADREHRSQRFVVMTYGVFFERWEGRRALSGAVFFFAKLQECEEAGKFTRKFVISIEDMRSTCI